MIVAPIIRHHNIKKVELHNEPVVIHITGDIDDDIVEEFGNNISLAQKTGQPVVPIFISSGGGEVYAMMSIVAFMQDCTIPIATIVTGFAGSAACAIFACGTEGYRYMTKNARLMMHDVSQMMCGSMSLRELDIEKTEMKQLNKQIFRVMAECCGKKPDFFQSLVAKKGGDLYLSASQAKAHNICNHFRIPKMESKISLTIAFENETMGELETNEIDDAESENEDGEDDGDDDDEEDGDASDAEELSNKRPRRCRTKPPPKRKKK